MALKFPSPEKRDAGSPHDENATRQELVDKSFQIKVLSNREIAPDKFLAPAMFRRRSRCLSELGLKLACY